MNNGSQLVITDRISFKAIRTTKMESTGTVVPMLYPGTWELYTDVLVYKIQHPFMIKTLKKLGTEGPYRSTVKATYDTPTADILDGGKLRACPLRPGTGQGHPSRHSYSKEPQREQVGRTKE